MPTVASIDTRQAVDWYRRNRARSEAIFDLIDPAAYYSRPISLRNPIVFYEGHLPAFSVIAFLRRGLGLPPVDARLETLFERGIDPDTEASAVPRSGASTTWPSRDEVRAFARACDEAVIAAMSSTSRRRPVALEGLYTALEHEAMHQETLLYMWHRLPYEQKRPTLRSALLDDGGRRSGDRGSGTGRVPGPCRNAGVSGHSGRVRSPRRGSRQRCLRLGQRIRRARRSRAGFDIDILPVTNAQFLEFIDAGGYAQREICGAMKAGNGFRPRP